MYVRLKNLESGLMTISFGERLRQWDEEFDMSKQNYGTMH